MFNVSRRSFMACAAAAGAKAFGGSAVAAPDLKLGVLSDIHIFDEKQVPVFEKALTYFRDSGVDGVIIAGDMADRGLLDQLELVGNAWFKVFPGSKAPDGRTVEKLFVYGNHDVEGHNYGDTPQTLEAKYPDERIRAAHRNATDPAAAWEKCFREPWAPVYAKKIKDHVFIGAHWRHEAELDAFLGKNEEKLGLKGGKPFFFAQHRHPGNTVYGPWAWGNDRGASTKALERYPNAVAFSGHSHYSLTDERSVWQGAFTSIGTSSLSYIFAQYWRENGDSEKHEPLKQMPCLKQHWAKQGMLVSVCGDTLVIERREFVGGEKVGPDWVVPLDGTKPFAFSTRSAGMVAPEFADGAKVTVERGIGKDRKGTPTDQVTVRFPAAKASATSRVFDYEVRAVAYHEDVDYTVATKRVFSESFHLPPSREVAEGACVFSAAELPAGRPLRFAVRPVECYGRKGRAIVTGKDFVV